MVLQRIGCRNHPYFKIVVQKDNSNLKGKYLEHVGYWQPREGKNAERSIVLNKHRIQYWLAHGVDPSDKVQYFLSLAGMLPAPLIKFGIHLFNRLFLGRTTLYDKPDKPVVKQSYYKSLQLYDLNSQFDTYRKQEEQNSMLQKFYASQEKTDQVDFN